MTNSKKFSIITFIICLLLITLITACSEKNFKIENVSGSFGANIFRPTMISLNDGKVLIFRNFTDTNGCNIVDIYNPETNKVSASAKMNVCRPGSNITKLSDGKILVSGGADKDINYSEIYDPETNKFYKTKNNIKPENNNAATLLPNNNVLILGNNGSISIFNPKTNEFNNIIAKGQYRSIKHLIPLSDNKILVINESSIEVLNLNKKEYQHPYHLENYHKSRQSLRIYSYLKGDDLSKVISNDYDFESYTIMPNDKIFLVDDDINLWLFNPINCSLNNISYSKDFNYFHANSVLTHLINKNEVLILYKNCSKGIFRISKINLFKNEIVDIGSLDDACLYYDSVSLPNGNVVIVATDPILQGKNIVMYDNEMEELIPLGNTLHKRERFKTHLLDNGKVLILGYFDWARNTTTPPSGEILEIK